MDGQTGVRTMLEMLREELRLGCILCGIAQVRDLGAESVTTDSPADWPGPGIKMPIAKTVIGGCA
jgi:isopentenyl diphosphate isomerase/L-lactate dehydrogenase-like FMN-dependent dehydrogenase